MNIHLSRVMRHKCAGAVENRERGRFSRSENPQIRENINKTSEEKGRQMKDATKR